MRADYKCECGVIKEYRKPYGESFPEYIELECGHKAKRVFSVPVIDIAEGQNGITYHPSKFSPRKQTEDIYDY